MRIICATMARPGPPPPAKCRASRECRRILPELPSLREHRGQHAPTDGRIKERGMKIEFLRKTDSSTTGNCPSLYRAENGNYVVQGWKIDDDTRARLRDLADNETA